MLYEELQKDAQVAELLKKGNRDLGVLGFTDHSAAHTTLVAERAAYILRKLGYSEREQELAKIAGLLHDIGNSVNRTHHAEYGALLAWDILKDKPLTLVEPSAITTNPPAGPRTRCRRRWCWRTRPTCGGTGSGRRNGRNSTSTTG